MNSSFDDAMNAFVKDVQQKLPAALMAMGLTAVELIQGQMDTGYGAPIWDTGALHGSIHANAPSGDSITVGTNMEYAPFVHDGTYKMIARPFIRDALENETAYQAIMDVATEQLNVER